MTPTIAPDHPGEGRLDHALFGKLPQRLAQLLGLHRVLELDPAQDLRRKARHPAKAEAFAFGQGVTDAQCPVVRDAHHVARIRLFGQRTVLCEEELRRVQADRLARADRVAFMPRASLPGADAHEGDAVAVIGVHVRLDLEHEPGHPVLVRLDQAGVGLLRRGRRRECGERVDEITDAEVAQCAAEEHRRQMPFAEGVGIERLAGLPRQRDLVAPGCQRGLGKEGSDARIIGTADRRRRSLVGIEPAERTSRRRS